MSKIVLVVFTSLVIAAGAAVVSRFSWVFYIFGVFLVYTAVTLLKHGEDDE